MARFPSVGEDFGAYRITRQIGRGGMGVVFAAEQLGLGRTVALKVLSPELAEQSDYRRRFVREASVLARVDSPHIITIFDHGEHDGCLYIATQYVPGGDLGIALRAHGPVPAGPAAEVAAQLAYALSDAHQAGVIHRDLKPSNVLLRGISSDVFAYLCDFGIAQDRSPGLTLPGAVAGTFAYLAPERTRGEPATPAADLYALGCVLWTSVTDSTPYAGTDVEIAMAHVTAPVPQLLENSPVAGAFNTVLRTALAKAPGERYADAEAMRSALLDVSRLARTTPHPPLAPRPPGAVPRPAPTRLPGLTGGPPGPPPPLPPAPPPPPPPPPAMAPHPYVAPVRRRRTPLAVAGAVVAVAVIAGGVTAVATSTGGDTPPSATGSDTPSTGASSPESPTLEPPTLAPPPTEASPTEPPSSAPPTPDPTPTPTTTPTPTPTEKPGPKPFYPQVPASTGVRLSLGAVSLRAPAGWGTIDEGIVAGGVGARDYGDAEGYLSSVFIRRSKPGFPLDSITLLDVVARNAVEALADSDDDLTLLESQRLQPAWLDGVRAARIRAAYRSASDDLELVEETWLLMKGATLYRVTFQFSRIDTLDERRAQIDPMVVSFRFD